MSSCSNRDRSTHYISINLMKIQFQTNVSAMTSINIIPIVEINNDIAKMITLSPLIIEYIKNGNEYITAPRIKYGLRCMPHIGYKSLISPIINLNDQGKCVRIDRVV